jgi:hypothetical protein
MITIDEPEIISNEKVVAYFKELSQHSPRGTEENHEKSTMIFAVTAETRKGNIPQALQLQPVFSEICI